jgi:hypothetical protein
MSPAGQGRSSGEWAAPVTQGQFDGFAGEVRGFMSEQRTQNGVIMSMLSEGQSTMAVLRRDTAEYKNRSDEASSKIRLLIQNEATRTALEKQAKEHERREETVASPVLPPPPKPTFWENAKDELSKKFISALSVVVLIIAYDQFCKFALAHPASSFDGETFSSPTKEHHGERAAPTPVPAPASAPAPSPKP